MKSLSFRFSAHMLLTHTVFTSYASAFYFGFVLYFYSCRRAEQVVVDE